MMYGQATSLHCIPWNIKCTKNGGPQYAFLQRRCDYRGVHDCRFGFMFRRSCADRLQNGIENE